MGWLRWNYLVPMPRAASFAALNAKLLDDCRRRLGDRLPGLSPVSGKEIVATAGGFRRTAASCSCARSRAGSASPSGLRPVFPMGAIPSASGATMGSPPCTILSGSTYRRASVDQNQQNVPFPGHGSRGLNLTLRLPLMSLPGRPGRREPARSLVAGLETFLQVVADLRQGKAHHPEDGTHEYERLVLVTQPIFMRQGDLRHPEQVEHADN